MAAKKRTRPKTRKKTSRTTASRMVTARIDPKLFQRLDDEAKKIGGTRTDVVKNILSGAFPEREVSLFD